jgi:hypothetical protein
LWSEVFSSAKYVHRRRGYWFAMGSIPRGTNSRLRVVDLAGQVRAGLYGLQYNALR